MMLIETDRLILRKPKADDFDRYWLMINDPVAKEFTGGVTSLSFDERLKLFLSEYLGNINEPIMEFSVIEKATNLYLGYCGFIYSNETHKTELIYGYCRDSWGKGYGYEAAKVICEYGFNVLKLTQIAALADKNNIASVRILNKLGMLPAGQIDHSITGPTELYILSKRD